MQLRTILIACCLLAIPSQAMAYVDPGTGMILFQSFIAGVAAFLTFVRNPFQFLRFLMQKIRNALGPSDPSDK